MSVTVEPLTEEHDESGWGERNTRTVIRAARISTPDGERTISAHGESRVLEHADGRVLDVDIASYWGEPEITVETNTDDLATGTYEQWEFTSIASFEQWISTTAALYFD